MDSLSYSSILSGINAMISDPSARATGIAAVGAALALVYGLCICCMGYKLRKAFFAICGFFIGCAIGGVIGFVFMDSGAGIAALVTIAGGAIGAALLYLLYKAGVFVFNASASFVMFVNMIGADKWYKVLFAIAAAIAVGVVSVKFIRIVSILSTSLSGGVIVARNAILLFGITIPVAAFAAVLCAGAGMAIQFSTTDKDPAEVKRAEKEARKIEKQAQKLADEKIAQRDAEAKASEEKAASEAVENADNIEEVIPPDAIELPEEFIQTEVIDAVAKPADGSSTDLV